MDELRALDSKAKPPANVFAYIFGGLAAIIFLSSAVCRLFIIVMAIYMILHGTTLIKSSQETSHE